MQLTPEEILPLIANKQRIVISGHQGVNTLARIVLHVLHSQKRKTDFIVNGTLDSTPGSSIVIIAGDETSRGNNDLPYFLKFKHHVGVITNIVYHLASGYPSEDDYIKQYDQFTDSTPKGGIIVYCEQDPVSAVLCTKERTDILYVPYRAHPHEVSDGHEYLVSSNRVRLPIHLSGKLNLQYISGAKELLKKIGITSDQFYHSITSYQE